MPLAAIGGLMPLAAFFMASFVLQTHYQEALPLKFSARAILLHTWTDWPFIGQEAYHCLGPCRDPTPSPTANSTLVPIWADGPMTLG